MMRVAKVELQRTVFEPAQFQPVSLPQVAVVGRSNVGKSSLINALVERKDLAHVSKTPGRTASINYFYLRLKENAENYRELLLVDLPGYGFAKTSKEERARWEVLMGAYFSKAHAPQGILLLLDIRREVEEEERWFFSRDRVSLPDQSTILVLTKADKCTRQEGRKIRARHASDLGFAEEQIYLTSRIDPQLDELAKLREHLGNKFGVCVP